MGAIKYPMALLYAYMAARNAQDGNYLVTYWLLGSCYFFIYLDPILETLSQQIAAREEREGKNKAAFPVYVVIMYVIVVGIAWPWPFLKGHFR